MRYFIVRIQNSSDEYFWKYRKGKTLKIALSDFLTDAKVAVKGIIEIDRQRYQAEIKR